MNRLFDQISTSVWRDLSQCRYVPLYTYVAQLQTPSIPNTFPHSADTVQEDGGGEASQ